MLEPDDFISEVWQLDRRRASTVDATAAADPMRKLIAQEWRTPVVRQTIRSRPGPTRSAHASWRWPVDCQRLLTLAVRWPAARPTNSAGGWHGRIDAVSSAICDNGIQGGG